VVESLECRRLLAADPGDTLASAADLGELPVDVPVVASEAVGNADPADVYKFSIPAIRDVTVSVAPGGGGSVANLIADFNDNGIVDNQDVLVGGSGGGPFHQRLSAGTYYVSITPYFSADNPYTLTLTTTSAASDPRETLGAATVLGSLPAHTPVVVSDWVGSFDPADVYQFEIPQIRDVTASVAPGGGSSVLNVIVDSNRNGVPDGDDVLVGGSGGGPFHQRLAAGTYFVSVTPYFSRDDSYTLTLAAEDAPADPGSSLADARNIGESGADPVVVSDWVGAFDPMDVYRFSITGIRDVTASVAPGGGSSVLNVIVDSNQNGVVDGDDVLVGGSGGGPFHQRLAAGSYYLSVAPYFSRDNPYALTLTSTSSSADPADTLAGATELGGLPAQTPVVMSDWVGAFDPMDVYRFEIPQIRDVTASVAPGGGNAVMNLIFDANENGIVDSSDALVGGSGGGPFHQRLAAGTYFVSVTPYFSRDDFYTLTLAAEDAPADPGSSLADARNIGSPGADPVVVSDWVGQADPTDVYRFTVPSLRDAAVSIVPGGGNAVAEVIVDSNGNGIVDPGEVLAGGQGGGPFRLQLAAGTYYVRVTPYFSRDNFYSLTVAETGTPPVSVMATYASGSTWTAAFRDALAAKNLGASRLGYRLPDGGGVVPLPWVNLDTILVKYTDPVPAGVTPDSVRVLGANDSTYAVQSVSADAQDPTIARIVLGRPIRGDRVQLILPGGPSGTLDVDLHFNILRGDANQDGNVNAVDLGVMKQKLNKTVNNPGTGAAAYSLFADVNADGAINALDLGGVKQNLNLRLPPVPSAAPSPLVWAESATRFLDDAESALP
jgi:hypothetical protein